MSKFLRYRRVMTAAVMIAPLTGALTRSQWRPTALQSWHRAPRRDEGVSADLGGLSAAHSRWCGTVGSDYRVLDAARRIGDGLGSRDPQAGASHDARASAERVGADRVDADAT
jgi:hypothetical protein